MSRPPVQPPPGDSIPAAERVPLKEKLAYGAGGVGGALASNADNQIFNPVFVIELGLSPAMMSLRGVVERTWDAVSDALMGWVGDNTRSRWGRRKPYILVGGVLMCAWLPVVFFLDRAWSKEGIFAWFLCCALISATLTTIWNIPYQCLLLECTPHSRERTNVAVWRGIVGKLAALSLGWIWYLVQLPVFNTSEGKPDIVLGARWVMGGIAILALVCALLPLLVKERVQPAPDIAGTARLSFRQNLALSFRNRPFVILLGFTLLFTLGFNLKGGLEFYTRLYYVFGGDQKQAAFVAGVGTTITHLLALAAIPIIQRVARLRGKKFALTAVMSVVFFASISTFVFYSPALPWLSILPGLLLGPAASAMWVLIPSMTGDVVDFDETRTGLRREGTYAATYSWFFKASGTLASALSGPLVVLAGFDQLLKQQPESVLFTMRVLLVVVPALCIGGAIWLCRVYPLTTERIAEMHEELARRRAG